MFDCEQPDPDDWHASLVPLFLAARYQADSEQSLKPREWSPEGAAEAIARATCVTIVHNLFHLGCFPSDRYQMLGLPEENTEWFPALRWRWNDGGESMNFLKAGLATSAAAVLVSPSYCEEVQTNELGCGMDKVLRSVGNFDVGGVGVNLGWFNSMSGRLSGIVNGIDVDDWNPATDPHIPVNYSVDFVARHPPPPRLRSPEKGETTTTVSCDAADDLYDPSCTIHFGDNECPVGDDECEARLLLEASSRADNEAREAEAREADAVHEYHESLDDWNASDEGGVVDFRRGKAECKAALQRELGLLEDPDAPLVGFIGRLDQQKGVDVLIKVVPHIVASGGQVVMLGSGDHQLEEAMRQMENDHRGRAVGWVGFSVPVSHRITAAADILAMPSRFEPCGLNQMYALRYGTIPVAHATGGLKDTVRRDVGYPFSPCEPDELRFALDRAFRCYREGREIRHRERENRASGAGAGGEDGGHRDGYPAHLPQGSWERKQVRAMTRDLSWSNAAEKYEKVFKTVALSPAPPPARMTLLSPDYVAGERSVELLAAAEALQREDREEQWKLAAKRAEKTRVRASQSPDMDTRTLGESNQQPSWYKMLPKKILLALLN